MQATHGRLPFGVYLLAFCLFAMGSAEFLVAGVLPAILALFRGRVEHRSPVGPPPQHFPSTQPTPREDPQ